MLVSVKITDNRLLWDKFKNELKTAGNREVVVGIQKGEVHDGVLVAEYATWNEFGTRTMPSRPFMRTYFDTSVQKLERFAVNGINQVLLGRGAFNQFFNAAGVFMVDGIKKSITNGAWRPNSPLTIKLKGSSKPLIDSGTMLNSVTFAIHNYGTAK
ncbi:hypothetical protein [Serratia proteamaculans]|uniref:hypothetical protein n=1 Tax=Serratia proteamaculans TaxID=28151 RepID=UPI0010DADA71|nr:hypothetical protein [Serratia proteamaculans]RYM52020.1 hypothetical protein BSQ97_14905 [Serratia proteamaculans]